MHRPKRVFNVYSYSVVNGEKQRETKTHIAGPTNKRGLAESAAFRLNCDAFAKGIHMTISYSAAEEYIAD